MTFLIILVNQASFIVIRSSIKSKNLVFPQNLTELQHISIFFMCILKNFTIILKSYKNTYLYGLFNV